MNSHEFSDGEVKQEHYMGWLKHQTWNMEYDGKVIWDI